MASTQLQPLERSPPQAHRPAGAIVNQLLEVSSHASRRASGALGVRRNLRAEAEQKSASPTRSPQQRPKSYAPLSPLAPVNLPPSVSAAAAAPSASASASGISPTNAVALPAISQLQVTNAAPEAAASASTAPVTADSTLDLPAPALPYSQPRPVSASEPHLILRRAVAGDYAKGHMQLLSQLTTCGEVSAELYAARLEAMARAGDTYHLLVVEDTSLASACSIVASATLVVELKLIHACAAVGHIEDVVVRDGYRGKSIGVRIMQALHAIAKERGCYKVMLDCNVENMHFYEKMEYKENSKHMRLDFH